VGLSFHYDTFSIEGMVGEKMVSSDFGGAADTWSWGCHVLGQTSTPNYRPRRVDLQPARMGALPFLSKAVGSDLAVGPNNIVGSD